MLKKCLSLVLTLCMILTLCIVQPVAYAQPDDAMVEIIAKLSDFQKGSTISLESDGYIGIPVDVSVYYDFDAHGKAVPGYNKTPVILYVVNIQFNSLHLLNRNPRRHNQSIHHHLEYIELQFPLLLHL